MKLGVLTVTFNRLRDLKKLLSIYDGDAAIDQLVIVNNNSNDGTKEYLDTISLNIKAVKIFHLEENTGGSGGFHYGLNYMKDLDLDWIYLSDDDAFPEHKFFSDFKKRASGVDTYKISAICASVIDNDEFDLYHRKYLSKKGLKIKFLPTNIEDYENKEFEIDLFSYVGIFINNEKLTAKNLPEKDYFIYVDDTEHSLQLREIGKILCWPELRVVHNTSERVNFKKNWRHFYEYRNRLHAIKKHFGILMFLGEAGRLTLTIIKSGVKGDIKYMMLYACSLMGGLFNTLGKHNKYKPGWK